ncbi:MAG: signal peptidase II [Leptospirillia bacterium]
MENPIPRERKIGRRWVTYISIAGLVFSLDQISKFFVQTRLDLFSSIQLIPHFFRIVSVRNTGIVFGLFSGEGTGVQETLLIGFTLLAMVGILIYSVKKGREHLPDIYPLALIFGGAAGNLSDRIREGRVVDFLDFYIGNAHWPAFNIADSAIVVGVGTLLILQWRDERHRTGTPAGTN